MAKSKRQTPSEPRETKAPVEELVIDAEVVIAPVEAPAKATEPEPAEPGLTASFSRDEEGRIVIALPGLPKRIAGNNAALPETLRQLGEDIIKRNLV